ncbi:hypothetical protein PS1_036344 [Malus domestica]
MVYEIASQQELIEIKEPALRTFRSQITRTESRELAEVGAEWAASVFTKLGCADPIQSTKAQIEKLQPTQNRIQQNIATPDQSFDVNANAKSGGFKGIDGGFEAREIVRAGMIMEGKNTVGEGEIAEMVVVVMVRIVVEGKNVTGVNNINVVEIMEESGVDTIFRVLVLLPGIPFLRRQFEFVLLETRLNLQVRNMV